MCRNKQQNTCTQYWHSEILQYSRNCKLKYRTMYLPMTLKCCQLLLKHMQICANWQGVTNTRFPLDQYTKHCLYSTIHQCFQCFFLWYNIYDVLKHSSFVDCLVFPPSCRIVVTPEIATSQKSSEMAWLVDSCTAHLVSGSSWSAHYIYTLMCTIVIIH